ncbi:Ig-like domain-containing protein [Sphingorhabdus sp. Alg231-15]|uniref:Ig-like domain-containing protein n=1 Tax=Sphingorhabdus sp. Alg231-15 TaxID=1922222 RepID=UPI000D54DF68
MAQQPRNAQTHLIALEPRMMFDGAAVVTAAVTISSADVLEGGMSTTGIFGMENKALSAGAVPNIGLAPPMAAGQDTGSFAPGSSDRATVNLPLPSEFANFSNDAIGSTTDNNSMAWASLGIVEGAGQPLETAAIAIAAGDTNEAQSSTALVLSAPVNTDPVLKPLDPSDHGSDVSSNDIVTEQVVAKEALGSQAIASFGQQGAQAIAGSTEAGAFVETAFSQDALQPENLAVFAREPGVRPVDFRDYFIIDDNDSRSAIMPQWLGYSPFSADSLAEDLVVEQTATQAAQDYIFIDTNVENYQELAETWAGKGIIVFIDGDRDGIDQIMTALAGASDIGAIHIVSHGDEGVFWLGTTQIDSAAVSGALASSLASIGAKLSVDGDILIYGCDVGADEAGQQLMDALAAATGADIAASIDDTGSILRGGDWTLENRLGSVEATSLVARDWDGLLATTAISIQSGSPTVRDGNGNIVPSNTRVGENATATWTDAGTFNGQQFSLRATIVSITDSDNIAFNTSGDDPGFLLRAFGTRTTATAEIRWDIFNTNSGAPIDIDVSFTVADIDGRSGDPRSREWVTVDTDTLSSFQNAGPSDIEFDTSIPGEVTASGTQDEGGDPSSAARFNWLDTSSFAITYNLNPNAASAAGFSHDGDLDFDLGTGGTTVSIPRLDLDRNDSTASGSGYQGTYVENSNSVGIVDRDVRITNPDGQVQSASITLTNAQAGDRLLVNGSDAASGTVRGISYTRTDSGVELTGADSANDYRRALRAITFENTTERPSEVDRNIEISFANAALSSNVAVSTISVVEINDPPTAVDDVTQTTPEDTPINNIDVLSNDFDGDGDTLSVVSASAPNGTVVINGDGTLNYTPNSGFSGTDTVTYIISDGRGGTSTATFDVTVAAVNDPPVPVGSLPPQSNIDAAQGIFVGTSQGFNDPDNPNSELTYSATGLPPGLSIDPDSGAITGTIDNSASQGGTGGIYNIVVTATDPDGLSANQNFAWTITNPPPQANNDGGSTNEDTPITVNVLANDQDPDGDDLTVISASASNGTVVINADGTLTYTPNADFNGNDQITYTISDGEGGTDSAVFDITVVAVNDGPIAVGSLPPQTNVDADSGVSVATASGFNDIDGPSISYSATGLPPGLSIDSGTGEITGTIDNSASQGGTNGVYMVTVTATDFQGTPATQTFAWTVTNPGPTAANDTASTDEDTAVNINVLGNDNDPDGDDLAVISVSSVNGSVFVNPDGTLLYIPNPGFSGTDTITYTISDGEGGTSTATVDVTVAAVNDAPEPVGALPPQTNVDADSGISLETAGGFTDSDDPVLTYSVSGLPAGLSIDSDTGEITGTIDRSASQGGSNGVYSVTVTATDPGGLSAEQTFSWTVTNPAPFAADDTATTNEDTPALIDVLPNDSDPDGDPITLIAAAASVGQATIVGNQVNYVPPANFNGTATITYTISDGEGGTATATIEVTVTPVNDAPVGTALPPQNTEDGATIAVPVADNFSDIDGDMLTYAAADLPPGLSIDPDSGVISGTIDNSASQTNGGTYTATITVSDGNGGTTTQEIVFNVSNPGPVAVDDSASTDEDTPVIISPLVNDSDPDGDDLTITSVSVLNGSVFVNGDGTITYIPNPGFNGTDTITYEISDGEGGTATAEITVTVADVNDTPVLSGSIGDQTNLDSQDISLPVAGAFSDPDGDMLNYTAIGLPAGLTIDPDTGVISGTIDRSASQVNGGVYAITVTADDGRGGSVSTSFEWTVTNPAPVATNDSVTTDEDTAVNVAVLTNDVDTDGDPLTITEAEAGNGTVTINPDGTLAYKPDANFNGEDTIVYTISDGEGGFSTATVTVTVTPVNDGPTTVGLANQNGEDGADVSIPTAQGFDDIDGDDLTFTASGLPPVLSIDPDTGLITGTLASDSSVNGPFVVTVTATDPSGESVSTTFVYSIQNVPPIAVDDMATTPEDTPVTVAVLTNDSDPDGDPLMITAASSQDGTVVVNADGTLTFTPAENFNGEALVTYTVSDGQGGVATATLTVDVVAVNDAPESLPIPDITNEDNQSVSVDTSSFFSDLDGDILTFEVTGLPAGLSIDPATGIISGTIDRDASQPNGGVYSVTVTGTDPDGLTTSQTFTWTVTNPAPTAVNDSATTNEDTPVDITVLTNDTDPDGDPLTVTMATALNGTVTVNPDGTLTYVPDADFNGNDTITYVISDGNGGTSTAAVDVTVNAVNDPPVAVDDVATTNEDTPVVIGVLGNDTDIDGDALTVTDATSPDGSVVINPDGTITFTPNPNFNGPTTITYTISDGNGGTSTATVAVTVDAVNDPPVAVDDVATTDEDTPVDIAVLANDTDVDGDPLTVTAADAPNGTVTINPDGTVTYVPDPDFNGTDTITYTISDGQGGFSTATVEVTVNAVNDAPVATPIAPQNDNDADVIDVSVASNFTDVDGDALTFSATGLPPGLSIDADGNITGTIDPDASQGGPGSDGIYSVTVTADDGNGGTVDQTFIWEVNNPAPLAADDAAATDEDTPVIIDVLTNDDDPDGDALSVTSATASNGLVTINPDGTITYSPNPDFNGTDTITYTISDGEGGTSTATVEVTVAPVNDGPVVDSPLPNVAGVDGEAAAIPTAGNFSDVDGDILTFTAAGLPTGLSIDPDTGLITGTIDNQASQVNGGVYTVTVTADDGNGGMVSTTFTYTVTNPAPTATNDTATTDEDTPVIINVLANDNDPDGDDLTVTVASAPNGTVVINPDGTITYTPDQDFNGTDTITYTISDGNGGTSTATVEVTVAPVNDAPEVDIPIANLNNEDADVISVDISDKFSDLDGDTLTFTATGLPAGLSIDANGVITGTIDPDASQVNGGVYTVTITADDGNGGTVDGSFTWTITNPAPTAVNDTATTDEDTPSAPIAVLANDNDPDGDTLTVVSATAPNGTVVINPDGTLVYTPAENFNGTDIITYQISDGNGGTSTATVEVTVTPVNDAPTADPPLNNQTNDDADIVSVDVSGSFEDLDGDTLTFTATGLPAGLSIDTNGVITGTIDPDASQLNGGVYTVTVTADDGNGGTVDSIFTWTVNNPPPVAANDTATTAEDTSVNIPVLTNDSDPDGDMLTVISADSSNGVIVIEADGTLTYQPDPNFNGTDTIVYTISDGNGGTATATVEVTVTPVNDAPETIGLPDLFDSNNEAITVPLGSAFSDVDDATLTYNVTGLPTGLTFDPATGEVTGTTGATASSDVTDGEYTVTVTATDAAGLNVSTTFTWTITNEPPRAINDNFVGTEDTLINLDVLANDIDPDGDPMTPIVIVSADATNGTAVILADGTIDFTPDPDFNGTATVTYTIEDANGEFATAVATIVIDPVNDAPDATIIPDRDSEDGDVVSADFGPLFSDPEGGVLTFSANNLPDGLSIDTNGLITGTIDADASQVNGGVYQVEITATDDGGLETIQSFIWTITNPGPTANTDTAATTEDTATGPIDVLANDNDPDGDALTVTTATAPNGTVVINADGTLTYTPDANFNGTDTITYVIDDGQGGSSTSTVTVTVGAENDAPTVTPLAALGNADADVIAIDVSGSFDDLDGDMLTFSETGLPPGLSIDAAGNITGTIDPSASQGGPNGDGIYSVTITADDGNGGTVSSTFSWTVTNPPPVANDDGPIAVTEDTPLDIDVLGNDTDPDGDMLIVTLATAGNGEVTINPDGTLNYVPDPDYNGPDTITYTISDGNGGTSTATVEINVGAVNDEPVASPITPRNDVDSAMVSVSVAANFSDVDGDTLTFTASGLPAGLSIDTDGLITGTIDSGASQVNGGVYTVTVTADDGNGGTVDSTFTWTITNPPPVAVNDSASTSEDLPVNIPVLANDNDPDGDMLTVTTANAANGTVVIQADGTIDYTPNQDFNGTDTITYTISDGNGGTATATVTVTVGAVNDPPVAVDDSTVTDEEVPVTIPVLANDSDVDGDPLTVTSASAPSGTVVINADGTVTYTPDPDFNGNDTITYVISDGQGGTATATVDVTVNPINDAPVAVDDVATTPEDTPITLNVLSNDSDVDGDPLIVTGATSPDGQVTINPDGTVTFTPDPDFNGTTTVTYTISDGNGGTATATVTLTVDPVNDPPVATPDVAQTDEDTPVTVSVLDNDTDADGDPLTVTAASAPNGTVVINADGTVTYTPDENFNGTDTITYTVSDGNGGFATTTATVTVNPVNDVPVANDDTVSTPEDAPVTIPVLGNDTDADGDPLTVTDATSPNGTVVINPDGTITFTPDPDFNGPTTITYTISDGNGGTSTATVTVDVTPVNDAPVVTPDVAATPEDTPVTLSPLDNASDVDGDPLIISSATAPNGTVTINPDGTITYTPDPNFNGTDVITYQVSDGNGGFTTATITVTVSPVNDPPVAANDIADTDEERPVVIPVLANDVDLDGDPLTITNVSAANGTVTINPDGTITYTPNIDFFGTDTITYTISDGNGGTSTATVAVTVRNTNEVPVDGNEEVFGIGGAETIIDVLANGSDPDGDPLSVFTAKVDVGTVVINPDGTISHFADPEFQGVATITYIVSDGQGGFVESTATVIVTQANANVNELLGNPGIGYPDSERLNTTLDPVTEFITTPLIIDDMVNSFRSLNNTPDLGGDRPLLTAVNGLRSLNGMGELDVDGNPIDDVVNQLDKIRDLRFGADRLFDPRFGDFLVEGLTGFSVRQLSTGSDQVMIESVVRDRVIYMEVRDIGADSDPRIVEYQLRARDGSPLPGWIRMDARGLAIIERPVDAETVRLIVRAIRADGQVVEIPVIVQGATGEIQIDEKRTLSQNMNGAAPLGSAMAMADASVADETAQLLAAFNS